MLGDFFRINLPYGLKKNDKDEWMLFNREYSPIGFNIYDYDLSKTSIQVNNLPIYIKYKRLTDHLIRTKLADSFDEKDGIIIRFWLYGDHNNPVNVEKYDKKLFSKYFSKLELLSKLKVEKE